MTLTQLHKAADNQALQCERFLREGRLTEWSKAKKALQSLEDRIMAKEIK
tara:strand:+ start:218 stop:367 length:150 start_codon:yes stop_codon:yes gene_type:complete